MARKRPPPTIYDCASLAEIERDEGPSPSTPADVLFGTTQRRLIGFLFGQPDRCFHVRELAELSGSGYGATQRELRRMEQAGLIRSQERRARRFLQADRDCHIHQELTALVQKTFGIAAPLREALSLIAPDIELSFVYESFDSPPGPRRPLELFLVSGRPECEGIDHAIALAEQRLRRGVRVLAVRPRELRAPRWFLARALAQPRVWVFGDEGRLAAMTSGP